MKLRFAGKQKQPRACISLLNYKSPFSTIRWKPHSEDSRIKRNHQGLTSRGNFWTISAPSPFSFSKQCQQKDKTGMLWLHSLPQKPRLQSATDKNINLNTSELGSKPKVTFYEGTEKSYNQMLRVTGLFNPSKPLAHQHSTSHTRILQDPWLLQWVRCVGDPHFALPPFQEPLQEARSCPQEQDGNEVRVLILNLLQIGKQPHDGNEVLVQGPISSVYNMPSPEQKGNNSSAMKI